MLVEFFVSKDLAYKTVNFWTALEQIVIHVADNSIHACDALSLIQGEQLRRANHCRGLQATRRFLVFPCTNPPRWESHRKTRETPITVSPKSRDGGQEARSSCFSSMRVSMSEAGGV